MKKFFKIVSVALILTALLAVGSFAEKTRVLRITMRDGSTRLFLAEHLKSISFKADTKDSVGMEASTKLDSVDYRVYTQYLGMIAAYDGKNPWLGLDEDDEEFFIGPEAPFFGAISYSNDGTVAWVNGDYNGWVPAEIPEDKTVNTVFFDRDFEIGTYTTVILPFEIALSKVHGAKFYALSLQSDNGTWKVVATLVSSNASIKANAPYLVEPTNATMTFDGPVTFKKYLNKDTTAGPWELRSGFTHFVLGEVGDGDLADTPHKGIPGRSYKFTAMPTNESKLGKFALAKGGTEFYPMQAYLVYKGDYSDIPESIDVEIIEKTMVIGGGTINLRTGSIRLDHWYDMQGRKLEAKPTTKGTYYHNGKQVIVK